MHTGGHGARRTNRVGRWAHWLSLRDVRYIAIRLLSLLQRYGLTPARASQRAVDCVRLLAHYGCQPTFPTPGRVVSKHPGFFRELQAMGAELAVHGYDHLDFRGLSGQEASRQFLRAAEAFRHAGIQFDGFRCPYLSYTDELRPALPPGLFRYSSNRAIWWDVVPPEAIREATAIFDSLQRFYGAEPAEARVATPHLSDGLLEIPASLPDDLQLHDGLKQDSEGLRRAWSEILHRTHRRGEHFVLLFHPESLQHSREALTAVLEEARALRPPVWVASLREVSRWWWEKARFAVTPESGGGIRIECSPRATVLIRNLETSEPTRPWDGSYRVLEGRRLQAIGTPRPFVGVTADAPPRTVAFLEEQGYVVDRGEGTAHCGVALDASTLARLESQVQLVEHIESSPAPLVRFWRWPDEYKSALCVTGDLDALSLMDYASRLSAP